MTGLPFLDTNIFIYAFTDDSRTARAQDIIARPYVTSVQAFNEFAHVMRRKSRRDWTEIAQGLNAIHRMSVRVVEMDLALSRKALDLLGRYNFGVYDALMVAAALEARATAFLSEDMQDSLIVEDQLTILNPFR